MPSLELFPVCAELSPCKPSRKEVYRGSSTEKSVRKESSWRGRDLITEDDAEGSSKQLEHKQDEQQDRVLQ